jgi:hypothetical protein
MDNPTFLIVLVVIAVKVGIAFLIAKWAKSKGRTGKRWYLFGLLFPFPTAIILLISKNYSVVPLPQALPTSATAKKSTWVVVGVVVVIVIGLRALYAPHSVTAHDLVQEASGQRAVQPNASPEEKQSVALIAQVIAIHKEGDNLNTSFGKTFTGAHLLEPVTFSSTEVASQSFEDVSAYCTSTMDVANRTRFAFSQVKQIDSNDHTDFSWATKEFTAANEWCTATKILYQYASDPTRSVHVSGGIVRIVGVGGYNERIETVNAASKKLAAAQATFEKAQEKERQEDGTTPSDYGFKP